MAKRHPLKTHSLLVTAALATVAVVTAPAVATTAAAAALVMPRVSAAPGTDADAALVQAVVEAVTDNVAAASQMTSPVSTEVSFSATDAATVTAADTPPAADASTTAASGPSVARADSIAACCIASRAYVRTQLASFGGEAGANRFKDALRRHAAELAATDGLAVGALAGDGFWTARAKTNSREIGRGSAGNDGDVDGVGGSDGDGGGSHLPQSVPLPPPPPLVVDVGANAAQGFPAWRAAFPGATIVAVEANKVAAARLAAVPAAGGRTHVIAAVVGGGEAARGGVVFRTPINESDGQLGGLWAGEMRPHQNPLPLDVLLAPPHTPASVRPHTNRTYPISLLKTDVEGWDVAVLQGAPVTVAATRFILFECSDLMATATRGRDGPRSSHAAAAEMLAAAGFEVYLLGRDMAVRFDGPYRDAGLDSPELMGWHNCAAVRRDEPLRVGLLTALGVLDECAGAYGVGARATAARR
ncbi:hypothetical protein MMPV_001501 [Pyropia vietnamensis]